jgi:hypothetical protein
MPLIILNDDMFLQRLPAITLTRAVARFLFPRLLFAAGYGETCEGKELARPKRSCDPVC